MEQMRVGDVVMVYEDPMTEKIPWMKAKLLKLVCPEWGWWEGRQLKRWEVRLTKVGLGEESITEVSILSR